MQNWLINFYPERMDIVEKAQQKAKELGGTIVPPKLSWKYSWIESLFGWGLAKRAQISLPAFRWSMARFWDKTLLQAEKPRAIPL
jgi:hypothetical protein